jgi:ribonuclease HI/exonuclease III
MDYNNTKFNTDPNYYPTFASPSPNTHSYPTSSYNDNALNPPSTSTDVTRQDQSRDPIINNTENIINKEFNHTQIPHINLATHNIQGAFFSKLHNILFQMISSKIDIIFLTEIHLLKSNITEKYETQTKEIYYYPTNTTYTFTIIINHDNIHRSSGTAFILSQEYSRHLQKVDIIEGRLIYLTLYFKKRIQLHILGLYIPPNPTEKKFIKKTNDILTSINKFLHNSFNNNKYGIILGDFNISNKSNQRLPLSSYDSLNNINYLPQYLHKIKNFINPHKISLGQAQPPTWSRRHNPTHNSIIDYIFISQNLGEFIINCTQEHPISYSSDHDIIQITVHNSCGLHGHTKSNSFSITKNKQQNSNLQKRFDYKNITAENWNNFQNSVNNNYNNLQHQHNLHNQENFNINDRTKQIYSSIITSADDNFKLINPNPKKFKDPLEIRQINNNLSRIIHVITNLKKIRTHNPTVSNITHTINLSTPDLQPFISNPSRLWTHKLSEFLSRTSIQLNCNFSFNYMIDQSNIDQTIERLCQLKDLLYKIQIQKNESITTKKINQFINRRENDIISNQRRMLNSILNRKPKRIIIDRLLINNTTTPNEQLLIHDKQEIAQECIKHYQNIGLQHSSTSTYTPSSPLPDFWRKYYLPRQHVSIDQSNNILTPITIYELTSTIRSLPNNKAAGPSRISYELIKHLPEDFLHVIVEWYNSILSSTILPNIWQHALLYPIPKPDWWFYDITKTRPIVLIDCFRKLFTKILNNRLNKFLCSHQLLQHNNQAGLHGSSTMEIIMKLQTIIESAKDNNSPLFILLQDLSKAYDRVNIDLLYLSLLRINLPPSFCKIICNLFTDRTNSIILQDNISDPYDVLIGIDQGESICPLLWVIYYDPMFEAINNELQLGITLKTSLPKSISNNNWLHSVEINLNVLGYLDDTTWFADSLENLEKQLKIADDFYQLANILINKTKTKLLTNDPNILKHDSYPLQYGNIPIQTTIIPKNKHERILGIYVSINNNHNFTYNKILRMTSYLCTLMNKKKITHDHTLYVINRVIIPRIEYLTQHIYIPLRIANLINRKLRSLYKQIASLPLNIYSSAIHTHLFPHIINVFDNQIQAQASFIHAQANSLLTSQVLKFLLLSTQCKFWSSTFPFQTLTLFNSPLKNFNRIESIITIFQYYNLSFKFTNSFQITGGSIPITQFLVHPKKFFTFVKSLKKKNIMFLDQVISPDGCFLKSWNEIKSTLQNKHGPTPGWYKFLVDNLTLNNNLRLNFTPQTQLIQNPYVTRPKIIKEGSIDRKSNNSWIASWSSINNNIIYGRIITKTHRLNSPPMIYVEHWIPVTSPTTPVTNSPHSRTHNLIKCEGCNEHYPYYIGPIQPNCIIYMKSNDSFIINLKFSTGDRKSIRTRTLAKSHHTLKVLAYNDYLARQRKIIIPNPPLPTESTSPQSRFLLLKDFFNITPLTSDSLVNITNSLQYLPNLTFYIDGSLKRNFDDNTAIMGFGWLITEPQECLINFNGNTTGFASSTRAEIFGLLTALVVCPIDSIVTIYTDSMNLIHTFQKIQNDNLTTRRFAKLNNHLLWHFIKRLLNLLHLQVTLIKVKAHSGDILNDTADRLAKEGLNNQNTFTMNPDSSNLLNCSIIWDTNLAIDKNPRKAVKKIIQNLHFESHLAHTNLSSIRKAHLKDEINWLWTQLWMKYNPYNRPTSLSLRNRYSWNVKISTYNLPTLDILQRNYPSIIKNKTQCLLCDSTIELNEHLWKCEFSLRVLYKIFSKHREILLSLLQSNASKPSVLINDTVKYSSLFKWTYKSFDSPIFNDDHPIMLLIRNYIPRDLVGIFEANFRNRHEYKKLLLDFIYNLHLDIYQSIWKIRSDKWVELKRSLRINKASFKTLKQRRKDNHNTTPQQNSSLQSTHRTRSEFTYRNPYNDHRSYRLNHHQAFIRFTSSNFLHNCTFYQSISNLSSSLIFSSLPPFILS